MKRGWDKNISRLYEQYCREKDSVYHYSNKNLIELTPIKPGQTIVDLACGTGMTSLYLLKKLKKGKIIVVDNSEEMLILYKKNIKSTKDIKIKVLLAKSEQLHKKIKEKVDVVVCNYAFWHFNINETLNSIEQVLKPKGIFSFSMPDHIFFNSKKLFYILLEKEVRKYAIMNNLKFNNIFTPKYNKRTIDKYLQKNKFELLNYKTIVNKETVNSFHKAFKLYTERILYKFLPSLEKTKAKKLIYKIGEDIFRKAGYTRKNAFFVYRKKD